MSRERNFQEEIKQIKSIIDSFNYSKLYLEANNCLLCSEKHCNTCIVKQAKRYLEIFTETTCETYLLGGKNETI